MVDPATVALLLNVIHEGGETTRHYQTVDLERHSIDSSRAIQESTLQQKKLDSCVKVFKSMQKTKRIMLSTYADGYRAALERKDISEAKEIQSKMEEIYQDSSVTAKFLSEERGLLEGY